MSGKLFLGIEISTQQVKVIVVDDGLNVVYQDGIKFDTDLPEFKTSGGVHVHEDHVTVTAPPLMWTKAVDLALAKMVAANFDFSNIAAVSGTGQQHGSVYWRNGARKMLTSLDKSKTLAEQLADCFSLEASPVWMDSSTSRQCQRLESEVGGALRLSEITGCRAYHRMTGNQIAKIAELQPDAYSNTERISLVSSFGASLFLGDYAAIDENDGSGMNLMDLRTRRWAPQCIQAFNINELESKLGHIVPSSQSVGFISKYFVERFGFVPECQVIAFTGDNPASLAGMRAQPGDIIVSLGTSDTLLLWLEQPKASTEGLVLVNPLDTHHYMGLLCFKNGSLTRERIRNSYTQANWMEFSSILQSTPRGNDGSIGIYFDVPEITPNAVGIFRFNSDNEKVSEFSPSVEVRAVIEGQLLSRRLHAENLGYSLGHSGRILATGGASSNQEILQILSDVFNTPVYVQNVADSACLGSAYRAKHGFLGGTVKFHDVVAGAPQDLRCAATPNPDASQVYDPLVVRYRFLEGQIASQQNINN